MVITMGIFNFEGQLKENGSRVITAGGQRTDVTVNGEEGKGTLTATTLGEDNTPALELSLELPEGPRGRQGIPGPQGPKGDTGNDGKTPTFQWDGDQLQICIDGNVVSTKNLKGPVGSNGKTPLIKVEEEVEILSPGKKAGIVEDLNPNPYDLRLKFKIPKGDKGDTPVFNKNVNVTTLGATEEATASISSDSSNPNVYTLSLEIPRGEPGSINNLTVSSTPPDKGFFVEDVSYNYEEGEGETEGNGTIQVQYKALSDARDELGILDINRSITAINGDIGVIDNKINELILVSDTQPYDTSNTQIWFDTSNPIGG